MTYSNTPPVNISFMDEAGKIIKDNVRTTMAPRKGDLVTLELVQYEVTGVNWWMLAPAVSYVFIYCKKRETDVKNI